MPSMCCVLINATKHYEVMITSSCRAGNSSKCEENEILEWINALGLMLVSLPVNQYQILFYSFSLVSLSLSLSLLFRIATTLLFTMALRRW